MSGIAAAARPDAGQGQAGGGFHHGVSSASPGVGRPQTAIGVDAGEGRVDDRYNAAGAAINIALQRNGNYYPLICKATGPAEDIHEIPRP